MKSSAGPVEPDGSYEVERIIDIRASKARGTEFLIKWRFYEDEHNTWEPEGLLDNCPLVLSAFKKAGGRSLSKRVSPASPSTSLAADVAAKRGKAAHGGKKAAQQEGEGMAAGKAAQLTRAGGGEEAALELNWLERLPPRRLKPLCEEKGLPVSGNSEALARRLRESGLGVPQLKALCAAEGLVKQGTKAEIARRLCDKLLPKAGGPESGGAAEQPKACAPLSPPPLSPHRCPLPSPPQSPHRETRRLRRARPRRRPGWGRPRQTRSCRRRAARPRRRRRAASPRVGGRGRVAASRRRAVGLSGSPRPRALAPRTRRARLGPPAPRARRKAERGTGRATEKAAATPRAEAPSRTRP